MSTVVIANPQAAGGRARAQLQRHQAKLGVQFGELQLQFTTGPGHATALTRAAIAAGAERIIAVGGDGTFNEVVNGFFDAQGQAADATLLCFPGGTGGDFARSIGLSGGDVMAALAHATVRRLDVGRASYRRADGTTESRYFINISSFGGSGMIVDRVNRSAKRWGGKASFFWGTLRGLLAYRNQPVRLTVDGLTEPPLVINTVAVANGRFFGGSMMVAPEAHLDDGLFDVVIIGDVGTSTFVRCAPKLYQGTHIALPFIRTLRGRVVEVEPLAQTPVLIDLDGEQPGRLPVRYELLPKAIQLLAPWDTAVT